MNTTQRINILKKCMEEDPSVFTDIGIEEKKAKLGTGARFKALKKKLRSKGATNPGALAAYIGRKKYGSKRFAKFSAKGRKG